MRTIQDRINTLLNYFGEERIAQNITNEDLVFCKGRAFSMHRNEMKCIAEFSLNPKSYIELEHSVYSKENIELKNCFHLLENDEYKYLQISLDDYNGVIFKENIFNAEHKKTFAHDLPLLNAIGTLGGAKMERFFIKNHFEEINSSVNHSYTVMVDIGGYGNAAFKATSTELSHDEDFLLSVQFFLKQYCKHEVSVYDLKNNFIETLTKSPKINHEEAFKLDVLRR